jgi:pimeloyl-ACP methyl ester carboxylesterase
MDLAFERRGAGEPLVLLHGLGSRRQVFAPVLGRLAGEFEVWALDMPGFGASPPPPRPVSSIGRLTDEVQAWLHGRGVEGCHVAGNSTGGGVALELAARGTVASATALAPIGFWSPRERAFCQGSVRATRALARRLRPIAPALLRQAPMRALLFAQYAAHPARIAPEDALGDVDALIGAPAFDDICAAFTVPMARPGGCVRVAQDGDDELGAQEQRRPDHSQECRVRMARAHHRRPHPAVGDLRPARRRAARPPRPAPC